MNSKQFLQESFKIATIPFGNAFIPTLASFLYKENAGSPHNLASQIIIFPTQRACRSMEQALLGISKNIMLPKIFSLNDLHTTIFGKLISDKIPNQLVIGTLSRIALIGKLINFFKKNSSTLQNHQCCLALLELLDDLQIHEIPLTKINEIIDLPAAQHWQEGLQFLNLIANYWNPIVKDTGKIERHVFYKSFIENLCEFFANNNFNEPIIIAGTTGSQPSTAKLIGAVLKTQNGRLILPGFDTQIKKEVLPTHPQWTMQKLLKKLLYSPGDVKNIVSPACKALVLQRVMDEKVITKLENGIDLDIFPSMVTAPNIFTEAKIITTIMRYHHQSCDQQTVALVTANTNLNKLVQQELLRFSITANQSLGMPLSQTAAGEFWIYTSYNLTFNRTGSSHRIFSTLKHPLCYGRDQSIIETINDYEYWLCKYEESFSTTPPSEKVEILQFWQKIHEKFVNTPFQPRKIYPFSKLLEYHIEFTKSLILADDQIEDTESNTIDSFLKEIQENVDMYPDLTPEEYPVFFAQLISCLPSINEIQTNQRLLILGTLESRLHQVDVVILGSLNEGCWPQTIENGPWLSPSCRNQIGLPPLEKRIGLASHDFCANFGAKKVYMTRSLEEDGAKTTPSRFWLRMETFEQVQNIKKPKELPWIDWVKEIDNKDFRSFCILPCFAVSSNPPINDRPQVLAASHIEQLMRDPYSFYARQILKLYPLPKINTPSTYRERGIFIHLFLEHFFKKPEVPLQDILDDIVLKANDQVSIKFWHNQINKIYQWLVNFYQQNKEIEFITEQMGIRSFNNDFKIFAIADRIDVAKDRFKIIDYKTTTPPSIQDINNGFSPQLLIEGLIAKQNGFGNDGNLEKIEIWHIKGKDEIIDIIDIPFDEDKTNKGLQKLLNYYLKEKNPFLACPIPEKYPQNSNYRHLERIQEWL